MLKVILMGLMLFLVGCDFFSDAKRLSEQLSYYRSLNENLNRQLAQVRSELANANITIEKLKAELQRSRTLHKKMLE